MALFTEEAVKANLRNKDGKRVFYLAAGDRLTPGARDYLRTNHVEILSAEKARPASYHTLLGATLQDKPESMTHLNSEYLVPKNHPRILFRGLVDNLEADLLLAQQEAREAGFPSICVALGEALDFARKTIRHDVLDTPLEDCSLGGLSPQELRLHSQQPQKYYNQPHFMPDHTQPKTLLLIHKARATARQTELQCYEAFRDREGRCTRDDLLQGYNRLSSFLWILEIRLAAGEKKVNTL